jgi:heat shock protein HtpX
MKISGDPTPMEHASSATAHLWLANPFKGESVSRLFMTHPPIEDRIAALRKMAM